MQWSDLRSAIEARYWTRVSRYLGRRMVEVPSRTPYISFTYDDFPQSALTTGGDILTRYNLRGTYYVSLGLLGLVAPTGLICSTNDVKNVVQRGHELGCHTFSHCHSWQTPVNGFEHAILQNRQALQNLIPTHSFESLAYPIVGPRLGSKQKAGRWFRCCRAGGQTFNVGHMDLNLLKAFFLEKARGDFRPVKQMIDANNQARGWLIFATHDICQNPTPYGCTPAFFDQVVRYAVESGATVLPVARALDAIEVDLKAEEQVTFRQNV